MRKFTLIKSFTLLVLIFLFHPAYPQFSDDFSDGNYSLNPSWTSSDNSFIVNDNYQLQLNANSSQQIAFISTPSFSTNNAKWDFSVDLDFNPSANNYLKIFLTSNTKDLTTALNGYFIRVGGSEDDICLYRQTGFTEEKIIDGLDKKLDFDKIKLKIEATRSLDGKWELWTSLGDSTTMVKEGDTVDNTLKISSFFGFVCVFTSTRSDKFVFDDINVSGNPYIDEVPPEVISISPLSANNLRVSFSEPVFKSDAQTTINYFVDEGIGNPSSVNIDDSLPNSVNLIFNQSFGSGKPYLLTTKNISDTSANRMAPSTKPFRLYKQKARYHDLIINEIMADPTPRVGLPEVEYIEIFNNSTFAFNLFGWQLSDGQTSTPLNEFYVLPNSYLTLCPIADTLQFIKFGNSLGVSAWPSLNNKGDKITLSNPDNEIIDVVNFTENWYKSSIRNQGGYSLELIDPHNPCSNEANWKASDDKNGGTPGAANSVLSDKPDLKGPELINVFPTKDSLYLAFNEELDTSSIHSAEYTINDFTGSIEASTGNSSLFISLGLSTPLEPGKSYIIRIHKIKDCNGNLINDQKNQFQFGLPEQADVNDVIINEILFNPRVDGFDFVEIYNKSSKFINLKDWSLANTAFEAETGTAITANRKTISNNNLLLAPQAFMVLTEGKDAIHKYYPQYVNNPIQEMEGFPSYPDKEGTVVLLNDENETVDAFTYQEDYHSQLIQDPEGVSLERISYSNLTQDKNNWTSAASTSSFATPGEVNSQAKVFNDSKIQISVEPKVITPNNDGYSDYATIKYNFRNQGYVASVYVYDAAGRLVRTLAENETLATEGFYTWEGFDNELNPAKIGIYMVYIEIFNLNGEVKTYKEPIVIGKKF